MLRRTKVAAATVAFAIAAYMSGGAERAEAGRIEITFENLAPTTGFFFTPVYGAFHDNSGFDIFDVGGTASPEFERLAEDGVFAPLRDSRVASFPTSQGVVLSQGGGPIGPQSTVSTILTVDGAANTHFVFASMLVPSQDAFIGLDQSVQLFDSSGNFIAPFSLTLNAGDIYDAGTEANSDNSQVAFLNQTGPDLGTAENELIGLHEGLSDFILDSALIGPNGDIPFSRLAADFTQDGFGPVARITIREVAIPEPATVGMMGFGLLGLTLLLRRRSRV